MRRKKEEKESKPTKELIEVRKLLKKWSSIVDDPKKKKQVSKIWDKIWTIKHGNIRPF